MSESWLWTLGSQEARDGAVATALGKLFLSGMVRGIKRLLPTLGSVEERTKGTGVGLAVALLLVPCSWHALEVYLQGTVPELVERAESDLLPALL